MVRYTTRGGKTNNRCNICIQNHPCTYALLHGPQVKLHITNIISSFSVMQTSQIVVTTQRGRLISRLIFLFLPACPTTGNFFKTRPSSDKPALSCYVECVTHFGVMRYVLKGTWQSPSSEDGCDGFHLQKCHEKNKELHPRLPLPNLNRKSHLELLQSNHISSLPLIHTLHNKASHPFSCSL